MNDKDKPDVKTFKDFPTFHTDEEAQKFVDEADLSDYDFSGFKLARFELRKKDSAISLRLPAPLLERVKDRAKSQGIPYQRFIRAAIEAAIGQKDE